MIFTQQTFILVNEIISYVYEGDPYYSDIWRMMRNGRDRA